MDRVINCFRFRRISSSAFNRGIETQINFLFQAVIVTYRLDQDIRPAIPINLMGQPILLLFLFPRDE